jgi:hypothetical protein
MQFTYRLFAVQDLSLNYFGNKITHSHHLSLKYDSMRDAYVYLTNNCEVINPLDPMGIIIIHKKPKPELNTIG